MLDLAPLVLVQARSNKVASRGKKGISFRVRRKAGVSMNGSLGSADTGTRGLVFMIADTSAINVIRTS